MQAIAASDETIARLRMYTRTGRPLGDESFLKRIEEAIERAIRAKSVGRPKGSKDKVKPRSAFPNVHARPVLIAATSFMLVLFLLGVRFARRKNRQRPRDE